MFSISNYVHEFLDCEAQKIKIFFSYHGTTELDVEIQVVERAINVRWYRLGGILKIKPKINYWVEDIKTNKFEGFYNHDLSVLFIDSKTQNVIEEKILPTSKVNISKRSLSSDFSKKNIWVIGDSHTNHFMNYGFDYDHTIFETNSAIINPISFPLLSINRFINSNYYKILGNLPIFNGDNICFSFGEIDTRIGIIRNSKLKNLNITTQVINLTNRFLDVVKRIILKYPNCKFYYILPNAPIRDGWICGNDTQEFLGDTKQHTRFIVRYLFEDTIVNGLKKIGVESIDIYKNYVDNDFFLDNKYLLDNNHHFKTPNTYLNNFKIYSHSM